MSGREKAEGADQSFTMDGNTPPDGTPAFWDDEDEQVSGGGGGNSGGPVDAWDATYSGGDSGLPSAGGGAGGLDEDGHEAWYKGDDEEEGDGDGDCPDFDPNEDFGSLVDGGDDEQAGSYRVGTVGMMGGVSRVVRGRGMVILR